LVKNKTHLANVHYYSFDEVPFKGEAVGMTEGLLRAEYFGPAEIAESNIHLLSPDNYQDFDAEIANAGGLDVMLIGIGGDGHFCANMPGSTR
ncbi:MAG: glucosamine-6-phosphate deaminase, partial [Carnobacterium sp.]